MSVSPQLMRQLDEMDRMILAHLEKVVPDGPREAEQIAKTIAALRARIAKREDEQHGRHSGSQG